jgi:hypothetical protein
VLLDRLDRLVTRTEDIIGIAERDEHATAMIDDGLARLS